MEYNMPSALPPSVPLHTTNEFRERRTRYCVVIPVLNEGNRIITQLKEMSSTGISSIADIIIADGGTSDGSLDLDFLCGCDVRALLVKRDSGKLSAQLRMGYFYGVREGYEGIITIDGNNKDSVSSIPLFIEALDQGVDYAQASRFVPGGKAINTPKSRHYAIKFVHAPLLSLAARKRYTDTTQGFRAYSRKYLLHPKVLPFRTIFQTYELLAYLTVRASQLGLVSREIPTTRTYPETGPTPTKLHFRGKVGLLKIIVDTLLGRFNP